MDLKLLDGITLPHPDAIRAKITQLSSQANALRRLLRSVNRVAPLLATVVQAESPKGQAVASAAR